MKDNKDHSRVAVWGRVLQAVSQFASSEVGRPAKRHFALLLACMLGINGLNVLNSYVGRDFISSVESRDMPRFMWVSAVYVLVFGVCTVVAVFYRFVEERLGLLWREWQTKQLLERYLENRTYLWIAANGEVENPDQRIAADVRAFATTSLSFFLMSLNALFTVIAFSGVMWAISPLLFGGAVGYGLVGSVATMLLGRRLVGLNYLQADREAAFRTELLQVRENAEAMAMLRLERRVKERLFHRFREVMTNTRQIIAVNRNVSFFTTGYNYLIPVIPVFVVAHLFMWGRVEFGVITQSSMAFAQLMGALSLIVTQFQSMSSYAAVLTRIRVLGEAMATVESLPDGALKHHMKNGVVDYDNVTLHGPDGSPLISRLSLTLTKGGNLFICSDNNRASRALFRATAGLWSDGEGHITRPDDSHIAFLPERPYLPKDTLRRLMIHHSDCGPESTARIEAVFNAFGLDAIPGQFGGLDVEQNWGELLTLEEQSQLAAARALLASPDFVVLDHPDSSLDSRNLQRIFRIYSAHGIGYICLGRSVEDTTTYNHVLRIKSDGTWESD